MINVVSATRLSEAEFVDAPLGRSLSRIARNPQLRATIAYENAVGLPEIYNHAIEASGEADVLVFVHDDVWIEDFYFTDRVAEALTRFDVVGLAGNRRRLPGQRVWSRSNEAAGPDTTLAGAVAHGDGPLGTVGFYGGPIVAEVELLDGVLIAARAATLRKHGVRFDPRFKFHFYDLDFCRTARARGLRLGTFPLSVTHQSKGGFLSASWEAASAVYFEKWGN